MNDQDMKQDQPDRTVLPPPVPPFKGKIDVAMKNSTQDWPQPLKAPEGAPNVLMIIGDDIGFGTPSAFGGPVNTPVFDRIAKEGLRYTDFHTAPFAPRRGLLFSRDAMPIPWALASSRMALADSPDITA